MSRIVAFIGDSIIYGHGDSVAGGWVERLRQSFAGAAHDELIFYNLGIRGDSTAQVAARIEQECVRRSVSAVVISAGGNDSCRMRRPDGNHRVALNETRRNVEAMLGQAAKIGPALYIGMVPVDEARMPYARSYYFSHQDQQTYKEAIRMVCDESRVKYFDLFDSWVRKGPDFYRPLLDDGIHPNAAGYEEITATLADWSPMRELLDVR